MCGIVGYVGDADGVPFILDGLNRLEYRGYDSAGVAVMDTPAIQQTKCMGRLAALQEKLAIDPLHGAPVIGHTRWATHGEPSELNSHPHTNTSGSVSVVHNGIIENYIGIRSKLTSMGHTFVSQTDTEVLPHMIDEELKKEPDGLQAICKALQQAEGAYAVGILLQSDPDHLYAARLGSPLIIGLGHEGHFIASDVPAIINQVNKVIYLNDGEVARLSKDRVELFDLDGQPVEYQAETITFEAEAAEKAGFETFMLKEIHEQPRVLRNLLQRHMTGEGLLDTSSFEWDPGLLKDIDRIMIISCGTAYHAGLYGKLIIESMTELPVEVDLASEFRYRNAKISDSTLIIPVSQSGETADTLASVRLAKQRGCRVLSVCNVPGSSLVRESDGIFYTSAGPEIGVASTKAYTSQLLSFALLSLYIGILRHELTGEQATEALTSLCQLPNLIHYIVDRKEAIKAVADKHHDGPSSLYLGRRFNYPTALEGALKNKEISYQHAEGYAAGEMKHGPIALINEYLPVICVCTKTADETYDKMISNVKEVEARHGRIIAVANDGDENIQAFAEDVIYVPATRDEWSPIVNVVALQLLAYYAAQARGTDIDKPRNLAKSVTVE